MRVMQLVKVLITQSVQFFATPRTVACQAPLFIKFSRKEYQGGLPFLFPGNPSDSGIEPRSPTLQANCLPPESGGKPWCSNYLSSNIKHIIGILASQEERLYEILVNFFCWYLNFVYSIERIQPFLNYLPLLSFLKNFLGKLLPKGMQMCLGMSLLTSRLISHRKNIKDSIKYYESVTELKSNTCLTVFVIRNLIEFYYTSEIYWASLIAQLVKNLPAMEETPV